METVDEALTEIQSAETEASITRIETSVDVTQAQATQAIAEAEAKTAIAEATAEHAEEIVESEIEETEIEESWLIEKFSGLKEHLQNQMQEHNQQIHSQFQNLTESLNLKLESLQTALTMIAANFQPNSSHQPALENQEIPAKVVNPENVAEENPVAKTENRRKRKMI